MSPAMIINPAIARFAPRHSRPVLKAGQPLYLPESSRPPMALDGTRREASLTEMRLEAEELLGSVGHWDEADGSNYNIVTAE